MNLQELANKAVRIAQSNSPAILTAIGVTGTISTAYLAARAGLEHGRMISEEDHSNLTAKEETALVWRIYVPPTIGATITIACVIGAAKAGSRKTAAITAAYSLSDKAFAEYREKVTELLGQAKEEKVRNEIAQDKVKEHPPEQQGIIVGGGDVLCCELHTGRYFKSDMEEMRKAQNHTNSLVISQGTATLWDFYHTVGLGWTTSSNDFGWHEGRLMELEFTTVLTPDGKPCLAFDYNYLHAV